MEIIIFIVIVCAVYYFYKASSLSDPIVVKLLYKNRSNEQKQVIRYFCIGGCFTKTISDSAYDALVQAHLNKMNFKQRGLAKIGLDESELQEIKPVNFEGFYYKGKKTYAKIGKDGLWRSSAYQVSWLFFSATQVYLYQYTFNLNEDGKSEITEEYFYKDITNISTSSDTVETLCWDPKSKKLKPENVDSNRFSLSASSGDRLYCSLQQNESTERAIQAMKSKLREKKSV
jgi:hypothetical protein